MVSVRTPRTGIRAGWRFAAVLVTVAVLLALAAPAGADADGYNDYNGDITFTLAPWDQAQGRYVPNPAFSVSKPGEIRQTFDTAWTNMQDQFCDQLEAGIKAGDDGWDGRNHCHPTPADQAQLRAKNLGTNLLGLRYFIPGNGASIYRYQHEICVIFCVDEDINVSFDLTIDVALRTAPGVGPEADSSTPLTVQSARLSFSHASFSASVCSDSCADAERKLNATVVDIGNQVNVDGSNSEIHTNIAPLNAYMNLTAAITAAGASFQLNSDVLPNLDPNKALAHVAWTQSAGRFFYSAQAVWASDTGGHVWDQTSVFGLPYGHWFDHGKPTGTSAASGPGATVGTDSVRHVFVSTSNGHLFEFDGTRWTDRGTPPGTTAVGTPAAGVNGTAPRAVVRTANGRVAERFQNSSGVWQWVDLGNPGGAITQPPAIVALGGYTAVVVTAPNGHLAVREALGASWSPWRDLGAFSATAVTGPSAVFDGTRIRAFVTDANGAIEQASFAPGGAASLGGLPSFLFSTFPTIKSAPSAAMLNGIPTIFATGTAGPLYQFRWTTFRSFAGYSAINYGTLLGATQVAAPTATGSGTTGFAIATNRHVAETYFAGNRAGLIDHSALSRVVYQAHAQDAGTVCCAAAAPAVKHATATGTNGESIIIIGIPPKWGTPANEGQTDTSVGILQTFPDAFRFQSTIAGSVSCQANAYGIGWMAEVPDSQVCGTVDQNRPVLGIRLRLTDTTSGLHILYRCKVNGAWTPFVADGMPCGATGLNAGISAVQVQYSDAAYSGLTYRALSSSSSTFGPWVDEGATAGQTATRLNAIEVHSNVGGLLRCQPYVGPDGWQNQVEDNQLCGSTDSSKHVDAFTLMLAGGPPGTVVQYRSKSTGTDWGPWMQNGQVSGAPGSGVTLDQVQVRFVHNP